MGYGLIQRATHDYIVTMAFARQPIDRRIFELAAFSLPAVAACVALLLVPPGYHANQAAPVVIATPLASTANAVPTLETILAAPMVLSDPPPAAAMREVEIPPQAEPEVKFIPYDGFAPTASLQAPEIAPSQPRAIIVQAGHTLWRIARETYGYGRDYPVIVDANRKAIVKPELIHPGQQLVLPDKKAN